MSDACMRTSDALRLVAEKIECIKPKQIKDIAWCIATLENASSQMDAISDEIYELRKQLSASQRREKAAVEDLKLHGGCPSCAHRIGNPPHSPCKKFAMDKQSAYIRCLAYEWRGPQEAVEGVTENG